MHLAHTQVEAVLTGLAAELGVRRVGYDERPEDALPFNILPPEDSWQREYRRSGEEQGGEGDGDGPAGRPALLDLGAGHPGAAAAAAAAEGASRDGFAVGSLSSDEGSASSPSGSAAASGTEAEVQALQRAVEAQASAVRELKVQGRSNSDVEVQAQVQELLRLKADLQRATAARRQAGALGPSGTPTDAHHDRPVQPPGAESGAEIAHASSRQAAANASGWDEPPVRTHAPGGSSSGAASAASAPRRSPVSDYYSLPIWQIHAVPMFFETERPLAKQFAAEAVKRVAEATAALARR
ncbi:hypothetical protein GPECTOR_2g1032 [Gonium pectorale]|uniref:WHEP-TRS domain-containing protein n=1 Tax=Gonium pectorale TaxID=33097 RepID=A0A150H0F7_GONPE|nr:hypothetical protein GPECTOR_2g1032 [Gonium pectorale]|eukprot:KXZ55483.1 hypothetical protein GPECTOR_2g1032 [Gonium pectorale]